MCADGSVAAWGNNNYGQLGTGDTLTCRVPVLVKPIGALAGKHVVAVAAAAYGSFALCDDGSLAAWGYNDEGELGDGTTTTSRVPVGVAIPPGLRVATLAAGQYHTLALCTDGTVFAWGYNNRGQLGNASTLASALPLAIGSSGALDGKVVVALRASGAHSLALCADGTLAAWGWNKSGQLGLSGAAQSTVPVIVGLGGAAPTRIALGNNHSLALLADGSLAAWGDNTYGQLGNTTMTSSAAPVAVDPGGLAAGARFMTVASGSAALHNLAVVALPSVMPTRNAALAAANLLERAFGLQAAPNGSSQPPQGQLRGGNYVVNFTQPAGVTDINYGAEYSTTLLPGSWIDVPDSGSGGQHVFSVPAPAGGKMFLRLKVTGP